MLNVLNLLNCWMDGLADWLCHVSVSDGRLDFGNQTVVHVWRGYRCPSGGIHAPDEHCPDWWMLERGVFHLPDGRREDAWVRPGPVVVDVLRPGEGVCVGALAATLKE